MSQGRSFDQQDGSHQELHDETAMKKTFPDDFRIDRSILVLPTYELSESLQAIPKTKADLVQLAKTGLAQPYHVKVRTIIAGLLL